MPTSNLVSKAELQSSEISQTSTTVTMDIKNEDDDDESKDTTATTQHFEDNAATTTTTTSANIKYDDADDNGDNNNGHQLEEQEGPASHHHGDETDGLRKKRNRTRKKKLYSEICQQMEFYFSDANISKNKMMEKLVVGGKDGYVDLTVFLDFNKIQKLGQDMDIIQLLQKALKRSEILELSEDSTKVRRKIPFDRQKLKTDLELEACTIYVENIPSHFDQDKLKEIFQEFGPISYVSIPKARQSGLNKGFAFVEFENAKSARCCVKAYGDIGLCLPDTMQPDDLQSVKTFEKSDGDETPRMEINTNKSSSANEENKEDSSKENSSKQDEERKQDPSTGSSKQEEEEKGANDDDDDEVVPRKRMKINVSSNSVPKQQQQQNSVKEHDNEEDEEEEKVNESTNQVSKKGKKKRRRNHKSKKIEDIEKCEMESIQLRIMPKRNWRQLRNRYLNLQRKHMSDLKALYRFQKQENKKLDNTKPKQKKKQKKEAKAVKPSVLVKIGNTLEPDAMKDKILNELMPKEWINTIQYIDDSAFPNHVVVKLDGNDDYIEAVSEFVQNATPIFEDVEILSAEASEQYWTTVKAGLKQKTTTRGRDKIMQQAMKANTHIRFDDGVSPEIDKEVDL